MQISLKDKVALVTGASRGIGRSIATTLAGAGALVVINYKSNAAAAEEVASEIAAAEGRAAAIQADISDSAEVERLFKELLDRYGKIDILVNNAGITRDMLLLRMKEEDFDAVLQTNLRGVYLCTKAALRPMTRARSGRIINITSVVGLMGNAGQANYAAAKAGVIGFTKAAAREIASRNITVNAVAPGYIETELTDVLSETVRQAILENIPLGRLGQPQDVADLVCFLASDAAGYITGQTLTVDGGMVMH
ncbi:MAG TPA: 3-oxoacyl-[acyl-carrier-protein] reductase [Roseiflexaceae bacterium]|nr:3-oxoacyl-[acyl-carrier-protein] reductase [Roseiflexaceae bacterium]